MQLVAYGAQDVYITGNPQITYFKVVYRRHTNFATENIRLPLTNANFGNTAYVVVTRNADLITQCYLEVKLPQISLPQGATADQTANGRFAWSRKIGHCLLDYYYIDVGGTTMDKQYADWLNIWQELTLSVDQQKNYSKLIGDVPELTELARARADGVFTDQYTLYLPLQLWFCRNNGLALPLIALQYHEVRLYFKFRSFDECVIYNQSIGSPSALARSGSSTAASLDAAVSIEYVYLDSDERRRFAQVGHEYLIEQVQYSNDLAVTSSNINQQMYFNHPSKMLVWAIKNGSYVGGKFLGYAAGADWSAPIRSAATNLLLGQVQEATVGSGSAQVFIGTGAQAAATAACLAGYVAFPCSVVDPTAPTAAHVQGYVCRLAATQTYMRPSATPSDASTDLNSRAALECSHYVVAAPSTSFTVPAAPGGLATATVAFLNAGGSYAVLPNIIVNALSVITLSRPVQKYADSRPSWVKNFDLTVNQHHNYGVLIDGTVNPVQSGNIKLNGQDRFEVKEGAFFNRLQPLECTDRSPADGINMFSFGLKPLQHQPSGACNMSRIDTAQLVMNLSGTKAGLLSDAVRGDLMNLGQGSSTSVGASRLIIFDFSYNVFRVMSGMGGLAYSN
jgi:hypothetical protein